MIISSKTLSICFHIVNKSAQGYKPIPKEIYFRVNYLVNPNKSVHPITL